MLNRNENFKHFSFVKFEAIGNDFFNENFLVKFPQIVEGRWNSISCLWIAAVKLLKAPSTGHARVCCRAINLARRADRHSSYSLSTFRWKYEYEWNAFHTESSKFNYIRFSEFRVALSYSIFLLYFQQMVFYSSLSLLQTLKSAIVAPTRY